MNLICSNFSVAIHAEFIYFKDYYVALLIPEEGIVMYILCNVEWITQNAFIKDNFKADTTCRILHKKHMPASTIFY